MVIGKVSAIGTQAVLAEPKTKSFKDVLNQKRPSFALDKTLIQINDRHSEAMRTINSFMADQSLSPQKMLGIQYKTSLLLLREQMFCKTVESCSNTLKNFTQMQV